MLQFFTQKEAIFLKTLANKGFAYFVDCVLSITKLYIIEEEASFQRKFASNYLSSLLFICF